MRKIIHVISRIIAVFLTIAIFSALTNWAIFSLMTILDIHLSAFVIGVLTTSIIIVLLFLTIGFLSMNGGPRRRESFSLVIDAMKQISRGNYNIKLEHELKHGKNHPFGQFVEGINDMAIELNEMEKMRQEFISNVSHEIQSPLASISGFAKVLKRSELTEAEREHYLNIIETESLRLARLSDNLLKLTSIESDHHPFEVKAYRLDQQIRKIILSCEPQWVEKSLVLDVSLDEVEIFADEELLSQVWVNFIHNSIKFTPNGGKLIIGLQQHAEQVEVTIADTGIGICEDELDQIFERFYKTDKSRNRTASGSGLGLSIAKEIIGIHKGSVSVQSKVAEGTIFTITLPIKSIGNTF